MDRRVTVLLVLLAIGMAERASSQTTGLTTGAIAGTVLDATGAALPGVAVVLSSPSMIGTRSTTTNDEGRYAFPALPVGDYALTFSRAGFAGARREDVRVSVAFTAPVDVELRVADIADKIAVVYTTPAIDRQSTAVAAMFDARQLARLPIPRSMGGIVCLERSRGREGGGPRAWRV